MRVIREMWVISLLQRGLLQRMWVGLLISPRSVRPLMISTESCVLNYLMSDILVRVVILIMIPRLFHIWCLMKVDDNFMLGHILLHVRVLA